MFYYDVFCDILKVKERKSRKELESGEVMPLIIKAISDHKAAVINRTYSYIYNHILANQINNISLSIYIGLFVNNQASLFFNITYGFFCAVA